MTHKRFSLRTLTLVGLVLGVLILTMAMLTSVQAAAPAITNSATVTGTPPVGDDVSGDTIFIPGIKIAKTPDVQTVASGSTVAFTIAVTNTGNMALTNVTVSDAQAPDCSGDLPNLLPQESTIYTCTLANVTDGFINSATVTGTSSVGDVTDSDAAKVKLNETLTCRPSSMSAYWRLDETSGTTYDDFYDGHDGECASDHDCPSPTTGRVYAGQEFNGSSTGINVPAVPGDDSFNWSAQDSFSIEFWMQTDSASTCFGNQVIVGREDSSTNLHWWTGCEYGGEAAFYLRDTSGTLAGVIGTTDLTDGAWHHVVAIRAASANAIRIYVDGQEENATTVTYTDGFGSPTAALNIGWLNRYRGYHFDGVVDEVAVYDSALSLDEVRQHYNEGLTGRWYCQGGTFAPIIVSTPVTDAATGQLYRYDVDAVGSPVPTYTLTIHPSGMTIDPTTGLISWIPTVAQEGNHAIEVEASNSEGSDPQEFTVAVTAGTLCPADMIAYWKLDETSGPPYDDFYDGHDGACAGQCPDPATGGQIDGGQEFNGSDTGINVPADVAFDWGATDDFSIEFWMQTDNASTCSGNEVVVGRDDSSTDLHWWVGCQGGGKAAFYLRDTGGTHAEVIGTTDLTDGAWHHVVAIRAASASEIRIYVDGIGENSTSATYTDGFDSTAALNIGWFNVYHGYHFDGIVDEVALYDRALSADKIEQHYKEAGPGYCINPAIEIAKTPDRQTVVSGSTVTFTIAVTNTGDATLTNVTVLDALAPNCAGVIGDLGPAGGSTSYECTLANVTTDFTNSAMVTGTHSLGGTVGITDTALVDVINPDVEIAKTPDTQVVLSGSTVTFTIVVTNTGDVPLTNMTVSDAQAPNCAKTSGDLPDLVPGENTRYECTLASVTADFTNSATVIGTPPVGTDVSDSDTAFVDVISPDISIVKTANPTTICAGDTVTYTYTVTNSGDDPLSAVSVSDDKCSPVTFVGGDTNSDDLLDVDETWTYRCVTTLDENTTNTATATGTNSIGDPISPDTDTAFVSVKGLAEGTYIYLPVVLKN